MFFYDFWWDLRCFRTYNLLISKRRSPTIYRLIPLLEVGNLYALKLTNMKAIFYSDNDEKPLDFDIIWGYQGVS